MPGTRGGLAAPLFSQSLEAVIGLLFSEEGKELHGRDIARRAKLSATIVARELKRLLASDLLAERRVANLVLYRANSGHPLYPELRAIALKTWGVRGRILEYLEDIQDIDCAFIFGSVAKGTDKAGSDVDVLVIGGVDYAGLTFRMSEASHELGRAVNAKLYRAEEWRRKANPDHPFFEDVLAGPKIFLVGDEEKLDALTFGGKVESEGPARKQAAARRRGRGPSKGSARVPGHRKARRNP